MATSLEHLCEQLVEEGEKLNVEKSSLEVCLTSVRCQLDEALKENDELKDRCLALEKQVRRYRKEIREILQAKDPIISETEGSDVDEDIEIEGDLDSLRDSKEACRSEADEEENEEEIDLEKKFLQETIQDLISVQENQQAQIKMLNEDLEALNLKHGEALQGLLEETEYLAMKAKESEEVVVDILKNHDEIMEKLLHIHEEYKEEVKKHPEMETSTGAGTLTKFKSLNDNMKGFMLACISVISKASPFGWVSWGFIDWLWARLLNVVQFLLQRQANFLGLFNCVCRLTSSRPFRNFTTAWEQGRPLDHCLSHLHTSEFFSEAVRVGPQILGHLTGLWSGVKA